MPPAAGRFASLAQLSLILIIGSEVADAKELRAFGVGPSGRGKVHFLQDGQDQFLEFYDQNNKVIKEWRGKLPGEKVVLSKRGRYVGIAKWSGEA